MNTIMTINPLSSNLIDILADDRVSFKASDSTGDASSFANILSDSLKTATEADAMDKFTSMQLLTGQSDDLSGMLLSAQKAEISLNLALQIRNKVIDAYNEIMRMQV